MKHRIISSLDDVIENSETWIPDLETLARQQEEPVIQLSAVQAISLRMLVLKLRREELMAKRDRLELFTETHGNSDEDGRCRHGVYVGGSGIDWMCGECEQRDSTTELAELKERIDELGEAQQRPVMAPKEEARA